MKEINRLGFYMITYSRILHRVHAVNSADLNALAELRIATDKCVHCTIDFLRLRFTPFDFHLKEREP